MSLQRSPTGKPTTYAHSNERIATSHSGGSQPDLTQLQQIELEAAQLAIRNKRKTPDDDLMRRFDEFQREMKAMYEKQNEKLTTMTENQNEKLTSIANDVTLIRQEITQIKSTTDELALEQNKLRKEVENITNSFLNTEKKIKAIEEEVSTLKKSTEQIQQISTNNYENIIGEVQNRTQRERNIIISGIEEIKSDKREDRQQHDKNEVKKILEPFLENYVEPIKILRLGKYSDKKSRPIKACYETSETAKKVLRNSTAINKATKKIKIYSDETPQQKENMKKLRDELKQRTDDGEGDLTIKYIKGTPRIIKQESKNH